MSATDEIHLGLSKELTLRPFFSLRPGEDTSFSIKDNGNIDLSLEIANSPFESVSQYGLTFQLTGMNKSFPVGDALPDIDGTGRIEISDLSFHKLLEGAPEELLGYKGGDGANNLRLTLSIANSEPLVFPSFSLPLDYSISLKAGEAPLLADHTEKVKVGETITLEANLGKDLEGFSCKILIWEQDAGGLPTEWKRDRGDIILRGATQYKAFVYDLEPVEEQPLHLRADWQVGVRDGIYDLGGDEGGSPENYEWSLLVLLYKEEPIPGSDFSKIDNSRLILKSRRLAFNSDKPRISDAECVYRIVESKTINSEVSREYHISYRLVFANMVRIPALNGQLLSIVQLQNPEATENGGSEFSPVDSTVVEDENGNATLSGTILIDYTEGRVLDNCRLFIEIFNLFNRGEHCGITEGIQPVIKNDANPVVLNEAPVGSEIIGYAIPLRAED